MSFACASGNIAAEQFGMSLPANVSLSGVPVGHPIIASLGRQDNRACDGSDALSPGDDAPIALVDVAFSHAAPD